MQGQVAGRAGDKIETLDWNKKDTCNQLLKCRAGVEGKDIEYRNETMERPREKQASIMSQSTRQALWQQGGKGDPLLPFSGSDYPIFSWASCGCNMFGCNCEMVRNKRNLLINFQPFGFFVSCISQQISEWQIFKKYSGELCRWKQTKHCPDRRRYWMNRSPTHTLNSTPCIWSNKLRWKTSSVLIWIRMV